nr:hypothetical protein CFP56_28793 [Quercus suber]
MLDDTIATIARASHPSPTLPSSSNTNPLTESQTFVSHTDTSNPPDLRLIHYNDVYHVEPSSRDPVGGIARFQTICDFYANDTRFAGQVECLTLFSGDAFNPSLESSVTKGRAEAQNVFITS